jgi:predicted ArsR family transcriptional regulator
MLAGEMRDTRQRIVDLLRTHTGRTVGELAQALHVTRTAITTQLAALQAAGLVSQQGLRLGRRRPSVVYVLTTSADALFPKTYDEFAMQMLDELRREGKGNLSRLLRRLGDRWIARDLPRVKNLRGRERLERVQEILAEHGFMPSLNTIPEGYLLREHNCPVMRLAVAEPEVCTMIHRWLEALFGTTLTRTRCMRQGDPSSDYVIATAPDDGQRKAAKNTVVKR